MNREDDESQAIVVAREQWRKGPSSGDLWKDWNDLRALLRMRFQKQHGVEDLEEVIQTDLSLLLKTSVHGSELQTYATRLAYLAVAYSDREKRTLAPSDNARALYFRKLALAILPEGSPLLSAAIRSQLALSLLIKANEKRDKAIMDTAYSHAAAAFISHSKLSGVPCHEKLDTLANVLHQRYLLCRDTADLELSIRLLEMEVKLEVKDLPSAFHNLSLALSLRFNLSGNLADLDRAIELGSAAVKDLATDVESLVDRVRNLIGFLETRFLISRDRMDIQHARDAFRHIVDKLSPNSSRIAGLSVSLSHLLRLSFETTNRLEDLEIAIGIARKGNAAPKPPSATKSSLRNELALLLNARYRRLGRIDDAHEALGYFSSMLKTLKVGDSSRCTLLSNMACTYDDLYCSTGKIEHLREAFKLSMEAMACSDVNNYPNIWLNGANQCISFYTIDNSRTEYLSKGIELIHQGLGVAHKWKIDEWAQLCLSAGVIYELRYRESREAEDLGSALVMYLETWHLKMATLEKRLRAIDLACNLLIKTGRWQEAWAFLQQAVELIPLYCASSLNYQDQQHMVSQLYGITAHACTAGLVVGDTERALEVWEQGRGIIVSSSYHGVRELSRLKDEHPDLYSTFCKRRAAAFETPSATLMPDSSILDYVRFEHRQMKSDRLALVNEVVQEIKARTGFEGFLQPVSVARMQSLAGDGAIVVLNPSESRTHAILVTKSRIHCIELSNSSERPGFFWTLGKMSNALLPDSGESLNRMKTNQRTIAVLYTLWQTVVKPICEALNLTVEGMSARLKETPPNIDACRIRWLTSGVFSRLPLHAAGIWADRCTDVLVKRAVSSYAASFRMLDYASERSKGIERTKLQGLIASMEKPNLNSPYRKKNMFLKSAQRESLWIQKANSKIEWKALVRPSVQEVLNFLPKYPLVHFATHGVSDPSDPMNSHLVLMAAVETQEPLGPSNAVEKLVVRDNLAVPDIFRCTASNAVLAFLAACCTADVRVAKLADESIHIANAFQVAGFPHVIGTLWPANEFICPAFAQTSHDCLGRWTVTEPLTNDLLAFAAHYSMITLIRDYMNEPYLWACFVHMGP